LPLRRIVLSLLLVAALFTPLAAQPPETETQKLLMEPATPAQLRAVLLAESARLESTDRATAGEHQFWAGRSYDRGGMADSAIVRYRRAVELRGDIEDRIALADALLTRRGNGDIAAAREVLDRAPSPPTTIDLQDAFDARRAWALQLAEQADSALALYHPHESRLVRQPEWRYRIATTYLAANQPTVTLRLLLPLAIASRRQDREVMDRLREAAEAVNASSRLDAEIDRGIRQRDAVEAQALQRMGASRGVFPGEDGFLLSGAMIAPPARKSRPLGAVVLVAPEDTIADYDSLGHALVSAGYAVMMLDVRGSGSSVGPSCPLPDRWAGREEAMQSLCARDTRSAFRALARATPLDSSRYLVVGVQSTATIAVEAAAADPRIAALLLVSPRPPAVERGPMRARLAKRRVPVYFQSGPEDFDWFVVTERLYQAGDRGGSRVADARRVGHGVKQFYYDPDVTSRFTRWLDETMHSAARPKPPPKSPRKG
jgi:alpha-beta hydrolase superfamily lysophospholipase